MENFSELSVESYINWVEQGDYSAMLFDGSLLQMTYSYDSRNLIHHRLAYIPSPLIAPDHEGSPSSPVQDWKRMQDQTASESPPSFVEWIFELALNDPFSLGLRSAVRFDYDREAAGPQHPEVHLTLNSKDCRIPCVDVMEPEHFVRFIIQTFYPGVHSTYLSYFNGLPSTTRSRVRFRHQETSELHVNWGNRP